MTEHFWLPNEYDRLVRVDTEAAVPAGKMCTRCKQHKAIREFPTRSNGIVDQPCLVCDAARQRRRRGQ